MNNLTRSSLILENQIGQSSDHDFDREMTDENAAWDDEPINLVLPHGGMVNSNRMSDRTAKT